LTQAVANLGKTAKAAIALSFYKRANASEADQAEMTWGSFALL
jgi:hypothetical protein